ncbi:hypothetical protein GGX14DRAFT_565874 [Mycena pura]|uniref:F-box domain-containing protein n=1 Tax=Mycena pura TaxID=153505 RepID=A0AAD6VDR2_9AGAR|nr:hypothetical protein GGX14DRAFT_565874 [Mycena pura]
MSAQLAAINQEIAWHYAQISILKAKANALTPISTLPNEIISKIFGMYAFSSLPSFDLKWSRIMLVCRRWYGIALAGQFLWSFIQVSSSYRTGRVRKQLELSGAAPLTVKIHSVNSSLYAPLLLQHAERLLEVELTGMAITVLDFMNSLPNYKLPLLRALNLDPSYKRDELPEGTSITLPESLFDGRAPRLTQLRLSSIPVNWNILRGLHSLSLKEAFNTNRGDSLANLLSLLEASSPTLTHVKLAGLLADPLSLQSYSIVSLPVMEFLWIQDNVALCNQLLRHLILPPTARILVYGYGIRSGPDIADLLVPIRKHVRSPAATTLRCLQFNSSDSRGTPANFMVCAFTAVTAPNMLEYDKANFTVNSHPTTENTLRQIMSKVLKALPSATITHLDCRCATQLTVTSWKAAIALLPALEMIYIFVNSAATKLFTALVELSECGGVYPPLRHIHLHAFVWKHRSDEDNDVVTPVLDALRLFLRTRHARGTPLEVLEIEEEVPSLAMREEEWEALFELVGRFIRDGSVYDPPALRREYEQWRLEWLAEHPDESE